MTGMERNADVIHMATYAPPLFARTEGWQWRPDMIWFDNLHAVRTSSYYVQQLFSRNKGNQVLPLTMNQKPVAGNDDQYGLFASAVWDNDTREIIVKVVNTSGQPQKLAFNFDGLPPRKDWQTELASTPVQWTETRKHPGAVQFDPTGRISWFNFPAKRAANHSCQYFCYL